MLNIDMQDIKTHKSNFYNVWSGKHTGWDQHIRHCKNNISEVEDVGIEATQNEEWLGKQWMNRESMGCRANSNGLIYV